MSDNEIFVVEFEEPGKDYLLKKKHKGSNTKQNVKLCDESDNTKMVYELGSDDKEFGSKTEIIDKL